MRKLITLLLALALAGSILLPNSKALAAPLKEDLETAEESTEPELDPKVEAMLAWAREIAQDNSHGYSQANRYGPNYDCTSFVCTALMQGGFGLDHYTSTSGMIAELPALGFVVYRRGETEAQRGDILLQRGVHAEICLGNGGCVAAHQDYDGRSGDRTGHEIEWREADTDFGCPFCKYRQYNYILRYDPERFAAIRTAALLPLLGSLNSLVEMH